MISFIQRAHCLRALRFSRDSNMANVNTEHPLLDSSSQPKTS